MANKLEAIRYTRGKLALLDQRLLPFETTYLDVPTPQAAWTQIKDMVVRGAPAIGVTGALAMAVDLTVNKSGGQAFGTVTEAVEYITSTLDYLVTSRPTAVNLADSAMKLKAIAAKAAAAECCTPSSVTEAVVKSAEAMLEEDIQANRAMGQYGSEALMKEASARQGGLGGKLRVLTHCNTGSLATAGFGTALGVIRALHEQGKLEQAYACETRPYNQGARLTAFELVHDGLPATLICDSAAASLMASGQVDAVVVGADRVVANGDTANKIGTYSLSILCAHHDIPFFVAAPTTTLDATTPDGAQIVIEQRPPEEVTHFKGQRVVVEGIKVYNPCFDVAPAKLITGIITEKGMVPKGEDKHFKVRDFMSELGLWRSPDAEHALHSKPPGFKVLSLENIKEYIASMPNIQFMVGPTDTLARWSVDEVGDGNINFVYIIKGPDGGVCVKQALPYVRCVGESWPLDQERVRIEAHALMEQHKHAPAHTPKVYHYDETNAIIIMQFLAPPFAVLRHKMVEGAIYPKLGEHVAEFLAATLFNTSGFKLSTTEFREQIARYTNNEMCRLTEGVIFTDPYYPCHHNRHTSPYLDAEVASIQSCPHTKEAICLLKTKFVQNAEALLHGDLHTGSIMVTEEQSMMIDPEFAYVGPMGFDLAKFVGEMLISVFATYGHEKVPGERAAQRDWILKTTLDFWRRFETKFCALWSSHGGCGDLYPASVVGPNVPNSEAVTKHAQECFMKHIFKDVVGFTGSFLIRRCIGIAHVADMDKIPDVETRAGCELRCLKFGRKLLTQGSKFADIEVLVACAALAAAP